MPVRQYLSSRPLKTAAPGVRREAENAPTSLEIGAIDQYDSAHAD